MGRPLELTDEIAETICAEVARGKPIALAAAKAGFTERAAFKWMAQGRADLEAGVDSVRGRFVQAIARARDDMSSPLVQAAIQGAVAGDDVRGILSVLKTFQPAYFGDRALEVTVALEQAAEAPTQADAGSGPDASAVRVELVRCPACGAGSATDEATGPTFCVGCGNRLPEAAT